ncbi:MAG TPA: 50S ribosomal protein L11 methyltransferase [Rhizomicrobium sp.]|jgi:predicted nicotinamide N-methyase|nr:50S ribosomal protein L11 methyltransferase [Rhizomicrobium sp.]
MTPEEFITTNAALTAPPLVPEIKLYLATEVVPLWRATEEELAEIGVPPPYWAFAWAGGQALGRYVLDNPAVVAGKRVLDIGAGSGLVAIAAAKAGAASVLAADIDGFSCAAIRLNAAANQCAVAATQEDLVGADSNWDVILVGDLFYERPLAERLLAWLTPLDVLALLGDPGRSYFPKERALKLASYSVQTSRDLEDREIRETGVYALRDSNPAQKSGVPEP